MVEPYKYESHNAYIMGLTPEIDGLTKQMEKTVDIFFDERSSPIIFPKTRDDKETLKLPSDFMKDIKPAMELKSKPVSAVYRKPISAAESGMPPVERDEGNYYIKLYKNINITETTDMSKMLFFLQNMYHGCKAGNMQYKLLLGVENINKIFTYACKGDHIIIFEFCYKMQCERVHNFGIDSETFINVYRKYNSKNILNYYLDSCTNTYFFDDILYCAIVKKDWETLKIVLAKYKQLEDINTIKKMCECAKKIDSYRSLCTFCLDGENCYVAVPCGHMCLCENCFKRHINDIARCPMCGSEYKQIMKVYF